GGEVAEAVKHALPALLEGLRLADERLVAPSLAFLDLVRHVLRRLAGGAGLVLGVGEELARLLVSLAASLRAVGIDRDADVARIVVGLGANALGFARQLLDARS